MIKSHSLAFREDQFPFVMYVTNLLVQTEAIVKDELVNIKVTAK